MQIQHDEFVVVDTVALVKKVIQQILYRLHRFHSEASVHRCVQVEVEVHDHFSRVKVNILERFGPRFVALKQLGDDGLLDVGLLVLLELVRANFLEGFETLLYLVRIAKANVAETFAE